MKRVVTFASFALVASVLACDDGPEREGPEVEEPAEVTSEGATAAPRDESSECIAEARGAVMSLKQSLARRLGPAMAESPEAAVEVCAREAETIRARVQSESGVELGRTASRLRNPDANGQAPSWVRSYLAAQSEGEAPSEWSELAEGEARLVSPLVTGELCLTCHGDDIAPPILAAIEARYPNDQARGYQSGDLRGVVWARAECDEERRGR